MKEYFSHDYNARSDNRLVRLQMTHGMEGVGIFWCIIEMLYEEGGYLLLSEYARITFELRTQYETVRSVIEDYDLFINDGEKFWSKSALERLGKRAEKSETARQNINKRWIKYGRNTDVLPPNNECNTIKGKERKGKQRKDKEIHYVFSPPKIDDVLNYFDENGYTETGARKFFNYYETAGWKDSKDNHVKNWKLKAQSIWFRDEFIKPKAQKLPYPQMEGFVP